MNENLANVNGFFQVTGIYTKARIVTRVVIAGILLFYAILLFVNALRIWPWWGVAICLVISLILIAYIASVLKKKPGIYLDGFNFSGSLAQFGNLFATTQDLKGLIKKKTKDKLTDTAIIPQAWKKKGEPAQFSGHQEPRFLFTIANQEHYQSTLMVPWHVSKIELLKKDKKTAEVIMMFKLKDLCVVDNNRAVFHFSFQEAKEGEKLLKQLSMLGETLKGCGISGPGVAAVKVIPSKTNKAFAAAFGAIGMGIASIMDEKKRKKFREDLHAGKISIINAAADRELLDLLKQLDWELTV